MILSIFDIILILIMAGFIFYGLFFGLIRTLGSLLGVIVGAWVASHFYLTVSVWLGNLFFGYNNIGKLVVFFLLFGLANRLVSFLFYLLDRAFDFISIIPFLKTINRLAGALFGFIEGGLILGLIIYVAVRYLTFQWFVNMIMNSQVAPFLLKFAKILLPLLPEVLKKLQSFI